jgi:hypothetical protein
MVFAEPDEQIWHDHKQQGSNVKPVDGVLFHPRVALITPPNALTVEEMTLDCLCFSEIASFFQQFRADSPGWRPEADLETTKVGSSGP